MNKSIKLAVILVLALLTACGSAATANPVSEATTAPTPTDLGQAETTTVAEPRIHTDALGRKVEIPANPQRIVSHYFASDMVALDPAHGRHQLSQRRSGTVARTTEKLYRYRRR